MEHYYEKSELKLKEYGRNLQNLSKQLLEIEDKEKRTERANLLIELMRQMNPNMRDGEEYDQKLWDHLHIMTSYQLDVDSKFEKPEAGLDKPPKKVPYIKNNIRYRHYGYSIEEMAEKAVALEDEEKKNEAIAYVGKLMKSFAVIWNKDTLDDKVIIEQLGALSKGKIKIDAEKAREEGMFDVALPSTGGNRNNRGGGKRSKKSNKNRRN